MQTKITPNLWFDTEAEEAAAFYTGMDELFADPDAARADRAMKAMLGMRKLDIAALRDAAQGVAAA